MALADASARRIDGFKPSVSILHLKPALPAVFETLLRFCGCLAAVRRVEEALASQSGSSSSKSSKTSVSSAGFSAMRRRFLLAPLAAWPALLSASCSAHFFRTASSDSFSSEWKEA